MSREGPPNGLDTFSSPLFMFENEEKTCFDIFQTYSGVHLGKYHFGGEESDFHLRNHKIMQENLKNQSLFFV